MIVVKTSLIFIHPSNNKEKIFLKIFFKNKNLPRDNLWSNMRMGCKKRWAWVHSSIFLSFLLRLFFFFFYKLLFNHIKSLNKLSVKLNIHKYMLTTKKWSLDSNLPLYSKKTKFTLSVNWKKKKLNNFFF